MTHYNGTQTGSVRNFSKCASCFLLFFPPGDDQTSILHQIGVQDVESYQQDTDVFQVGHARKVPPPVFSFAGPVLCASTWACTLGTSENLRKTIGLTPCCSDWWRADRLKPRVSARLSANAHSCRFSATLWTPKPPRCQLLVQKISRLCRFRLSLPIMRARLAGRRLGAKRRRGDR